MAKGLIDEIVSASPNRRRFLKTLGAATAGVTALSMAGIIPAEAQTTTEVEVLKFALNLEYLESEFYTYALYGQGIELFKIGVTGAANGSNPTSGMVTTGGKKVAFSQPAEAISYEIAEQLGSDERAHVTLLRTALGSEVIAKPNINLNALGFGFDSTDDFLRLSRIFEDIGVSAYGGAAGLLTTPAIITTAARILAAESEHVAAIRTQIIHRGVTTSALDPADIIPLPSGKVPLSINPANGLSAIRTPGEVLYLAFGGKANATSGGFFPSGVNGAIITSTGPATAASLA
jgi:hypothetical protein